MLSRGNEKRIVCWLVGFGEKFLRGRKENASRNYKCLSKPFHPTLTLCFYPLSEGFEGL
jgi:predicted transposase YbfD/YdcC